MIGLSDVLKCNITGKGREFNFRLPDLKNVFNYFIFLKNRLIGKQLIKHREIGAADIQGCVVKEFTVMILNWNACSYILQVLLSTYAISR